MRAASVWDLAVLTLEDPGRLADVLTGYAPPAWLARRLGVLLEPDRLLRRLDEAVWLDARGFDAADNVAWLRVAATAPDPACQPGPARGSGNSG